jgi:hypothetical protein
MKPDHLFCMIGKSDPAAMQICFDRRSSRVAGFAPYCKSAGGAVVGVVRVFAPARK